MSLMSFGSSVLHRKLAISFYEARRTLESTSMFPISFDFNEIFDSHGARRRVNATTSRDHRGGIRGILPIKIDGHDGARDKKFRHGEKEGRKARSRAFRPFSAKGTCEECSPVRQFR